LQVPEPFSDKLFEPYVRARFFSSEVFPVIGLNFFFCITGTHRLLTDFSHPPGFFFFKLFFSPTFQPKEMMAPRLLMGYQVSYRFSFHQTSEEGPHHFLTFLEPRR